MDDGLRQEYESLILHSGTFERDPKWHFVFLENQEILQGLLELLPELETADAEEALLGFAEAGSYEAVADTAAALWRVFTVSKERQAPQFSVALTRYFQTKESQRIAAAFGVPEGYVCAGALLFWNSADTSGPALEADVQWNVFSYIR
ncbi:MAG: hypothetical protein IKE28_05010 [Solobacterium sp.]|nr:hypothetical protein [Solobacterium sp.]